MVIRQSGKRDYREAFLSFRQLSSRFRCASPEKLPNLSLSDSDCGDVWAQVVLSRPRKKGCKEVSPSSRQLLAPTFSADLENHIK